MPGSAGWVRRRGLLVRGLVPVGLAAAVGVAGFAPALAAGATPTLPQRSAQQVLARAANSHVDGLSGTVRVSTDFGLPKLPNLSSANPYSLLSGTHTLRVATAGPEQLRVALLGSLSERELVRNGSDVWAYDSNTNAAIHWRLPAESPDPAERQLPPQAQSELPATPDAAARQALAAIDPTTAVAVDRNSRVAGRAADTLVLTPRQRGTLVGKVTVAVDGATGVPLRVAVYPKNAGAPALDVAYTAVSLRKPGAKTFAFAPPARAKVTEHVVTAPPQARPQAGAPAAGWTAYPPSTEPAAPTDRPTVVGHGWTAVLEARGVSVGQLASALGGTRPQSRQEAEGASIVRALLHTGRPVKGAFGTGRLFSTRLLSVLVTDDGRAYAGMVTPAYLLSVASK